MSFDGMMTRAVVKESHDLLKTGRINKIYQPFKTELIVSIRAKGKSYSLLLSANAKFARAHLTGTGKNTSKNCPHSTWAVLVGPSFNGFRLYFGF